MARTNDELKKDIEDLIRDAKNKQAALEALTFLFPKIGTVMNSSRRYYANSSDRAPPRQISNAQYARTYFNLTPDDTSWGKTQADALAHGGPEAAFEAFHTRAARIHPRERTKFRRVFLDLLSSITRQIEQPADWFMSLLLNAQMLLEFDTDTKASLFDLEINSQVTYLLIDILTPLDGDERADILSRAISHSTDVSLVCDVFRTLVGDAEQDGAKGQSREAFGDRTAALRDMLVRRVVEIAETLALYKQIRPQDILWFWWGSGDRSELRNHTLIALEDGFALRTFLNITVSTVYSSAGNYERVDRKSWSKIVDLELLECKAIEIIRTGRTEDIALARRFLTAYETGNKDDIWE